jgi:hypothetical protein
LHGCHVFQPGSLFAQSLMLRSRLYLHLCGKATPYFKRLNYLLPEGESVADWLIDISSGRLEPDNQVAKSRQSEKIQLYQQTKTAATASTNLDVVVDDDGVGDSSLGTMPVGDSSDDPDTTAAQKIEQDDKVSITGSPLVVKNGAVETAAESEKVDGATTEAPSECERNQAIDSRQIGTRQGFGTFRYSRANRRSR